MSPKLLLLLGLVACRNDAITWAHAVLGPEAECQAMHTSMGTCPDVDIAMCAFHGESWYCEYGGNYYDHSDDRRTCHVARNTYGLAEK